MPRRSRIRGYTTRFAGWLVCAAGAVGGLTAFGLAQQPIGVPGRLLWVAAGMLGVVVFLAGRRLTVRARQHLAGVLDSAGRLESESFVLYLRAFDDDALRRTTQPTHLWDAGGLLRLLFLSSRTQEEQIALALRPAGRLVAVGRPGEQLPEAGALRLYLADDEWQEAVLGMMRRARLVVLALGRGDGLLWELSRAVEEVEPHRLVLLVGQPVAQVIRFDDEWDPEIVVLVAPDLGRRDQLAADLAKAFEPVLRR